MKILDTNNNFILAFTKPSTVFLIDSTTLQIIHQKQYQSQIAISAASLQYSTGIAAICIGSKVHFYDFFYQRQIDTLETYKPIIKVCLRKNILIVLSYDRILVYNVEKKQNESYIQTINGKLVFFDQNYTSLSIFYPEDHSVLVSKPIWSLKGWKCRNGVKYENGCYFDRASKVVLSLFNTLSFYEQGDMIKIYGFDHKIVNVRSTESPKLVFVLLQNNEVIGQNLSQQLRYEFEEVKQNGLINIEAKEQKSKGKGQSSFWITNGEIYVWRKEQNGEGRLFRAKLSKAIKHISLQKSPKEQSAVEKEWKQQVNSEASL